MICCSIMRGYHAYTFLWKEESQVRKSFSQSLFDGCVGLNCTNRNRIVVSIRNKVRLPRLPDYMFGDLACARNFVPSQFERWLSGVKCVLFLAYCFLLKHRGYSKYKVMVVNRKQGRL